MKYSKLKNEMEVLELKHQHQMAELKMKQEHEMRMLKQRCGHIYEDGTSAKTAKGTQWNYYHVCTICNKTIR